MSKQTIYNTLIQSGMTREAALGMMGNMMCESGLEANRVQGDFSPFRTVSKSYTARVDNGSIGREDFGKAGIGFGLCQWTFYSRRFALFDFWKDYGGSIGDPVMQARFCVKELKENYRSVWDDEAKEYVDLWKELTESNQIYTCTKDICRLYERPAHNNIDARFRAARQLEAELTTEPAPEPEPEPAKEVYWPPRMICKGMSGPDVSVLQALLTAHGFECEITGDFNVTTHNLTIAYQSQNALDQDGIAGPKTFASLLRMG